MIPRLGNGGTGGYHETRLDLLLASGGVVLSISCVVFTGIVQSDTERSWVKTMEGEKSLRYKKHKQLGSFIFAAFAIALASGSTAAATSESDITTPRTHMAAQVGRNFLQICSN